MVALLTSGCGLKLFESKIYVECRDQTPSVAAESKELGVIEDQSSLREKEFKKKPRVGQPTTRSQTESNTSTLADQTYFVTPVDHIEDSTCPTYGNEEAEAIAQETGTWCWATSAQTVMRYHVEDRVEQCDVVSTALNTPNCCNAPWSIACQKNKLPSLALTAFGFEYRTVGPLEPKRLAAQICDNGPFIFVLHYAGGGGHSFVVDDYEYDEELDELFVWVNNHSSNSKDDRTSYSPWRYEDFAAGRFFGTTHRHSYDYVQINFPER